MPNEPVLSKKALSDSIFRELIAPGKAYAIGNKRQRIRFGWEDMFNSEAQLTR
ncbi:hypothetical protein [Achromobacter dolens]|uniref:hypothetical protein n=1 Tax=Achromobacter dolens TaxID=1287738 RepID=UPI001466ABB4|nr:hypothetical protein [Achromobacter dolens]CAB3687510.1 hypothetical protein LMG26840_04630 [Achromobacter dolens]